MRAETMDDLCAGLSADQLGGWDEAYEQQSMRIASEAPCALGTTCASPLTHSLLNTAGGTAGGAAASSTFIVNADSADGMGA